VASSADWELYKSIKIVGTRLAVQKNLLASVSPRSRDIDLYPCVGWSENLGVQGHVSTNKQRLLDLAGIVVSWRELLRSAGYPEDIWRTRLVEMEEALVTAANGGRNDLLARFTRDEGEMIGRFGRELVRLADRHRSISGRRLPRVLFEGGCGAGGLVDVRFRTYPPNGVVSIISEFGYELCRLGGNPADERTCTDWRRAKSKESVSGVYYVLVKWPDRTAGPVRYDLSNVEQDQIVDVGDR
jgi:hypothetical protein